MGSEMCIRDSLQDSDHAQTPQQQQQPKKLRFITNSGAPHPKRRRVTAACLTCRRRKIACSGEQPTCHTCNQSGLQCAGFNKSDAPVATESSPQGSSSVNLHQQQQQALRQRRESSNNARPDLVPNSNTSASTSPTEAQPIPLPDSQSTSVGVPLPSEPSNADIPGTDAAEQNGQNDSLFSRPRDRMPYFRWYGPTAIMPGFKQMLVKVGRRLSTSDDFPYSPSTGNILLPGTSSKKKTASSAYFSSSTFEESDMRTPLSLPFYDTSSMPPSELITHLCTTFFVHLGCNFPFLQQDRFLKDLAAKQVDAILVDAMCALAARFSSHPLLVEQTGHGGQLAPPERGHAFAQRAKVALIDTYTVPSVAAVQAALLLAYNEFGEARDSGLWVYLGISIRLAQDLGLPKLEGLRYEGRDGPTPRTLNKAGGRPPTSKPDDDRPSPIDDPKDEGEIRAIERERSDTFWAVFFLDRVISVGTGRRSTLRSNDIELSFPNLERFDTGDEYPSPFPALIRIIHLYGRVADLLNSIKEPSDITPEIPKKLADMESQVTHFYQGLSPRLHFEAMNFHHYVKAGEGTNFVLLHFWFHTLIIFLNQPTLLKTFEGKMLQLFPNSQQLSMSSAKTIADILSYSQLIDTKACFGSPFTCQPIYIAACVFLKETAEQTATPVERSRVQSQTSSQAASPRATPSKTTHRPRHEASAELKGNREEHSEALLERSLAKHTLLAKAASQHYQLCYKALESLETYWSGSKYIRTVLDQKFRGVGDPLLYTAEEGESSLVQPEPEPAFTSPGWRRKMHVSWVPALDKQGPLKPPFLHRSRQASGSGSPKPDHSHGE